MPGNRKAYEAAMQDAANAAWDHKWTEAIGAYQIALTEFPEDTGALSGMGMALVESNRLDEALDVYNRIVRLAPDDPLALEKWANVLELLGRGEEAGRKYVTVADIYLARRNVERAVANWERAVGLLPNEVKLRSRLAVAYERTNQMQNSVREYVTLASIFQRANDLPKASQALQRALKIDPTNEAVRNSLAGLRDGSPIDLPESPDLAPERRIGFDAAVMSASDEFLSPSPKEMAAELAMSHLAELLFEGALPDDVQSVVAQVIEQQRAGDASQAIASYEWAMKNGLDHPAAWLNAGLLYFQIGHTQKAAKAVKRVATEPDYATAANLTLGQIDALAEKWGQAAHYLVEAVRYADLSLAEGNAGEIHTVYDDLQAELGDQADEKLEALVQNLVEVVDAEGWERRVTDLRARLLAGERAGRIQTVLEPGAEKVSVLLDKIGDYIDRGMLLLAMEEAHYAIELSPWHLPVHVRMAEILTNDNKIGSAAAKYTMIANTYIARGDTVKAADMFAEALQLSPLDLAARRRLIEMLLEQGRGSDALRHYEELAEVYLTMADIDKAQATYQEAITLAQQFGAEPTVVARLLHEVGDLDVQKLDLRQAVRSYEQIRQLVPGDERANLTLVDLYFRLEQTGKAIQSLDDYLGYCIRNNRLDRIVPVLEEQVRNRPDEASLRQRLAKVYSEQDQQAEAIAQLDALGELLLEAGQKEEAAQTIRQIVEMNPPDVDGYRQLLQSIERADGG